jgi:hypothetical protein
MLGWLGTGCCYGREGLGLYGRLGSLCAVPFPVRLAKEAWRLPTQQYHPQLVLPRTTVLRPSRHSQSHLLHHQLSSPQDHHWPYCSYIRLIVPFELNNPAVWDLTGRSTACLLLPVCSTHFPFLEFSQQPTQVQESLPPLALTSRCLQRLSSSTTSTTCSHHFVETSSCSHL